MISFAGIHTALVTPFRNELFDEAAFKKIIDLQFEGGVTGVVPCGTTGESPTLDYDEHELVIRRAVEFTDGRGLVMAGTGSNSTREAIELTQKAEQAGAHAALVVAPYYNKPTHEGLVAHFTAIAKATSLPIMLYSVPGRCGIEIDLDTILKVTEKCPNVVAIKEASGNVERINQMRQQLPKKFEILSGDDSITLAFMAVGAVGVVSVASNIIPKAMSDLVNFALKGDFVNALKVHEQYYPLLSGLLRLSTNPLPIKTAMIHKGLIAPEFRLPLVEMTSLKQMELKKIMQDLKIID
jgi:4-hydroxy-tetrahydrodipicolinate synthase